MQKIKRTDVRKRSGGKSFLKAIILILVFILLFLIGFFSASALAEILN